LTSRAKLAICLSQSRVVEITSKDGIGLSFSESSSRWLTGDCSRRHCRRKNRGHIFIHRIKVIISGGHYVIELADCNLGVLRDLILRAVYVDMALITPSTGYTVERDKAMSRLTLETLGANLLIHILVTIFIVLTVNAVASGCIFESDRPKQLAQRAHEKGRATTASVRCDSNSRNSGIEAKCRPWRQDS
jgi:hypothetical protein